jgi:hypothetical protein
MNKTIAIVFSLLVAGCSSSSTNNSDAAAGSGGIAGAAGSGGIGGHAGTGGAGGHVSTTDAAVEHALGADGPATFTLTLENYLSWCSVTEAGTSEGTTATVTMSFPAGTVVDLNAMAASNVFVWDYWVGTDGDTTATHDTSMSTTVTMTKDKTVQACCPFAVAAGSAPVPCPAP